jgi:F-type H+/Na+-transporting ATPase subunit beta
MEKIVGKISQVIGPVVDVAFENTEKLPSIYESLEVINDHGLKIVLECQQHMGEDTVRTVAMDSTDGLYRGMEVVSSGGPITMPADQQIRGRLFNVIGETIDGLGPVKAAKRYNIHNEAPKFENLKTETEVLYTGSR